MKTKSTAVLCLLMLTCMVGFLTSCSKDDAPTARAEPRTKYIRITHPPSSDSLLLGAGQGTLIAIVGENLQGAQEIWCNDQKAVLTPTYITPTSILVSVPSMIPNELTNSMTLIFANGRQLVHDFQLQISKPVVANML